MEIRGEKHGEETTAFIFGEIDHHNAKEAREKLDRIIDETQPISFSLDLSGVTFCDSSGLGLVMGRMRKCLSVGSILIIKNPSEAAYRILQIAGMDKILKIERG
ncbi:MAG: STAS domain-containing protein [Clostridia bacterium]|nr:STAS domain-containing protein [Clostridia bacterium]